MKKILAFMLFLLFMALCCLGFISCGARHVKKEQSKEEIKSEIKDNSVTEKQIDTNIKTTIETKTDDKNETITEETVYEPQDNTKESFVIEKDGSKVVLNNAKKIVRNTTKKNNTQSQTNKYVDSVRKDTQKENKAIEVKYEAKKESKAKEAEKKQFNPMHLFLGFLLVMSVLFFICKRLKIS